MRPPIGTTAPTGCVDAGEDAGDRRLDLDHRLVGLDLGDELAGLDAFALGLRPAHDLAFADREVAEGHGDRLAVDGGSADVGSAAGAAVAAGAVAAPASGRDGSVAARCRAPVPGDRRAAARRRRAPPRRSCRRRPAWRAPAPARRDAMIGSVCRRPTGASSSSKASSFIAWPSSAPMPHIAQPSSTTSSRSVLRDARNDRLDVERHDGAQVDHLARRCLRARASRPPRARDGTSWPPETIVRSVPARAMRATPKGTKCSPVGTGPLDGEQRLGLEHDHRIAGAQRRLHQPLGVGRRRGHADDQAGDVRPDRVIDAAVVRAGTPHCARADADHHRRGHLAVAHVAELGRLEDDLPGGLEEEVGEHQVGDRSRPGRRGADRGAGEAQLGDRRVDHALRRRTPATGPWCGRRCRRARRCLRRNR